MGKTRDIFKKIRDTKGIFYAKMGSIKDRNGRDLQKQKILRRGGKNTQKNCTKKIFTTKIITIVWSLRARHPGMWSQVGLRKHHYEQRGGDGIPVELFQILKDESVKVLHSSKFEKLSCSPKTGKGQFSFQSQRRAMSKNAQTTTQLLSSHKLVK